MRKTVSPTEVAWNFIFSNGRANIVCAIFLHEMLRKPILLAPTLFFLRIKNFWIGSKDDKNYCISLSSMSAPSRPSNVLVL